MRALAGAAPAVAVMIAACSGTTAPVQPGSASAMGSSGAVGSALGSAGSASGGSARAVAVTRPAARTGDAQLRVEWKDPPPALRRSGGRTACGDPRPPAVDVTSTWGVRDAVVWLDVAATTPVAPPTEVRVVVQPCGFVPRVSAGRTGAPLALVSAIDHPVSIRVVTPSGPRTVQLPVIGHTADLALPDGASALAGEGEVAAKGEGVTGWAIGEQGAVGVTDVNGELVLRGLPAGHHRATAWLPDANRTAHAELDVLPGGLAEVTLQVTP